MNIDQSNNASTEFLNFSEALHHLRWGDKIARRKWTRNRHVQAQYGQDITGIAVITPGFTTHYRLGGSDIMAEDWYVV
jgi:hypothetical protein